MIITILGSGSKGNSTLIETEKQNILIDAGIPLKNIEKRLNKPLPKIDILIITHTHQDHIKGLKSIIKKHNPEIYTIENDIREKIDIEIKPLYDKEIKKDNLLINLFEVSHDVPCIGIEIFYKNKELLYITDTGYIKERILNKVKNKDIYIIESNYEEKMLMEGSYPFHLKQRIRSDRGHLSNDDTNRYLKKIIGPKTKYICLAHLSEENNDGKIVLEKTNKLLKDINNNVEKVIICSQYEKTEIKL